MYGGEWGVEKDVQRGKGGDGRELKEELEWYSQSPTLFTSTRSEAQYQSNEHSGKLTPKLKRYSSATQAVL
jgi:hypothetical protein